MKSDEHLYFIAITPPQPIYDDAMAYKNEFSEKYNAKAALKSPPHITLHMPFRLKAKKEVKLIEVLNSVAIETQKFEIELKDFGQFNLRTIFMQVLPNDQLHQVFKAIMKTMKINFNIFNADYKSRGFNPHLTLAFRDLKKEAFKAAWLSFESAKYSEKFLTQSFDLLKHNGKNWDVFKSFDFS